MSKPIITFGNWNGYPIQWIVLKEDDYQTLMVSHYALFNSQYNLKGSSTTWKTSFLRQYLNNDFYETAFSDREKIQIVNVLLTDVENSKDNVFILSCDEAKLFSNNNERISCLHINSNRTWIRNQRETGKMWGIDADGAIDRNFPVTESHGVNPALYLKK